MGCYIISIHLGTGLKNSFGRYNHGDAVFLPAGGYLYVGSARGEKGSSSLGARLMRHATRTDPARPHAIREELLSQLQNAGITAKVPAKKQLHWHIDYLLDLPEAEINGMILLRTRQDREARLAEMLAALPQTSFPAPGLGASDHRGNTHLFYLQEQGDWPDRMTEISMGLLNPDDGMAKI